MGVIFKNALGVELELTSIDPFIFQKIEPSNNVNIYSFKGMLQDGDTYLGNTLDKKDISLKFAISAESKEVFYMLKEKVDSTFNPNLDEGYLIYNNKKIKCAPSKLPYYTQNIGDIYCECLISLTASNPYWQDLEDSKASIALWKGDFHFPLVTPKNKGIKVGHREPSLIVNINNKGHVKTGMIIEFYARGTLSNPSLFNINTRESIKINKSMVAGEKIIINTNLGRKKVLQELNGVTTDIMNYLDIGGEDTFLQLDVGDNLLRYNAETNLDNLEVSIYFNNNYLGA